MGQFLFSFLYSISEKCILSFIIPHGCQLISNLKLKSKHKLNLIKLIINNELILTFLF